MHCFSTWTCFKQNARQSNQKLHPLRPLDPRIPNTIPRQPFFFLGLKPQKMVFARCLSGSNWKLRICQPSQPLCNPWHHHRTTGSLRQGGVEGSLHRSFADLLRCCVLIQREETCPAGDMYIGGRGHFGFKV